jgi:hypothetical protein
MVFQLNLIKQACSKLNCNLWDLYSKRFLKWWDYQWWKIMWQVSTIPFCIWSGTESVLHHAILHDRMVVSYDPNISWYVYKLSFLFYLLKSDVRIGDVDGCYGGRHEVAKLITCGVKCLD